MSLPIVDETTVEELDLPGRYLRWVVTKESSHHAESPADKSPAPIAKRRGRA